MPPTTGTTSQRTKEQEASVAGLASVHVVEHDTFHHNVPQFLQQHGELVPLLEGKITLTLPLILTRTLAQP